MAQPKQNEQITRQSLDPRSMYHHVLRSFTTHLSKWHKLTSKQLVQDPVEPSDREQPINNPNAYPRIDALFWIETSVDLSDIPRKLCSAQEWAKLVQYLTPYLLFVFKPADILALSPSRAQCLDDFPFVKETAIFGTTMLSPLPIHSTAYFKHLCDYLTAFAVQVSQQWDIEYSSARSGSDPDTRYANAMLYEVFPGVNFLNLALLLRHGAPIRVLYEMMRSHPIIRQFQKFYGDKFQIDEFGVAVSRPGTRIGGSHADFQGPPPFSMYLFLFPVDFQSFHHFQSFDHFQSSHHFQSFDYFQLSTFNHLYTFNYVFTFNHTTSFH